MINMDKEELRLRIGNADPEEQAVIAAQIPTPVLFKELEKRSADMEARLTVVAKALAGSEDTGQNFFRQRFNKVY